MAIADEDVAAVKGATDLVALVSNRVAMRKRGAQWVGRCPFHTENTPSFYVNPLLGRYHCFGCGESGDAIEFVKATEHLDFAEAVEALADRAGITLRETDRSGPGSRGGSAARGKRAELLAVMERAVQWYHQRLVSGADAAPARQYLASRGYGPDTVERFSLGWAPDDWDALTRALGLSDAVLRDTGLGFVNRVGRRQDGFRSRLLFPIFEPGGRPVAFGGRVLPGAVAGAGEAKYKNSPESAVYSKRQVLYGLNWAKEEVAKTGEVVVCEGYTDVIALFQAGLPRAVAICGTSLAEEHFKLLRRFARRVVLALDADRAGQGAAEKFYEWERRHELEVVVADLPAGTDPAELGQRDPEALRAAVEGSRSFLAFRVERTLAEGDLRTPESRARVAEAALAAVAEHPSELVRDPYVMQIAARCRIEDRQLRVVLERIRRATPKAGPAAIDERPPRRSGVAPAPGSATPAPPSDPARSGAPGPGSPGSAGARVSGSQDPGSPEPGFPGRGSRGPAASQAPGSAGPGSPGPGAAQAPGSPGLGSPGPAAAQASGSLELVCLRLAVHRPGEVAGRLTEVLFEAPVHRAAFRALACSPTLGDAIVGADPPVAALLARLAVEPPEEDPEVELPRLVGAAARRALGLLSSEIRAEPARAGELAPIAGWLKRGIEALNEPSAAGDAAAQLLAWLSGMVPRATLSEGA